MVVDTQRSSEDFDYWEYCDIYGGWNFVCDQMCSRNRGFVKEISGALFVGKKEIIF